MSNTQDELETAAINFANSTKRITRKCPNNVLNPGLYFGYMAGYEKACERITELETFLNSYKDSTPLLIEEHNKYKRAFEDSQKGEAIINQMLVEAEQRIQQLA